MADQRPIGFMDSGFGGLSVLRVAKDELPFESFVYYGDNQNAPYGRKSCDQITKLVVQGVKRLMQEHVKCIVIACNTATSAAIDDIRALFSIPIISMEPAIKPAILQSKGKGIILMMGTPVTCQLKRYKELKAHSDIHHQVKDVPCFGLVEAIERNLLQEADYSAILENLLSPYKGTDVSGTVLGCTHFPFIVDSIRQYAKINFRGACEIYDGAKGTVRHLRDVMEQHHLTTPLHAEQKIDFITTGDSKVILPVMQDVILSNK